MRRRSESQLLAHCWCLHVNPAECFVYGLLHMARGGAAGGCKYYSWTLLSLKTDSVFLSLFPRFYLLTVLGIEYLASGRDLHRK